MKPKLTSEPDTLTKKCQQPRQPTVANLREDKLKKIHKASQHRKPAKMLSTQRQFLPERSQEHEVEEPEPFRELFDKVYRERTNLNSLLVGVRKVEEVVTPQELAGYLVESMTWAVSCYRSELSISCIRIFNNTLKQEGSSIVQSLTDLAQNRKNLLGLLHTIYEQFASVVIRNQMVVSVVTAIGQRNQMVKQWLQIPNTPIRTEVLNCSFFHQLMDRNDMLRSFCVFAEQLLTEELMDLTNEQRKELHVVVELSKLVMELSPEERHPATTSIKRNRRKKKPSLTADQLEELQTQQLISEFERMQLPTCRLMVEFTDDFLLGIRKQVENGWSS